MSYILDALRRAEAERARGHVPGLHSPGLPASGVPTVPVTGRGGWARPPWAMGVLGLALAVLGTGLGAWWVSGPTGAAAPATVARSESPVRPDAPSARAAATPEARPVALSAIGPAAEPAAEPVSASLADAAVPLRLPTPAPAPPPVVTPAATAQNGAVAAAAVQAQGPLERSGPAVPVVTAVAPGPAVAANATATAAPLPPGPAAAGAAPAAAITLAALSAEQRAAWPQLAIGGAIYSDHPGSRFVIVNGQVVREGQYAAPGVVVERIGRGTVLLQWRGLRVQVPV